MLASIILAACVFVSRMQHKLASRVFEEHGHRGLAACAGAAKEAEARSCHQRVVKLSKGAAEAADTALTTATLNGYLAAAELLVALKLAAPAERALATAAGVLCEQCCSWAAIMRATHAACDMPLSGSAAVASPPLSLTCTYTNKPPLTHTHTHTRPEGGCRPAGQAHAPVCCRAGPCGGRLTKGAGKPGGVASVPD